ncbi:gliding motility-associated C-terminal domain-containing protein, partial [Cesiribacter sp. SM1]|uniref:T9SS type B sorting domain-containing protein n=1 Tax=Cesiribacter sp. SM1 TaxID=2861196 RepID=UPI001CD7F74E
MKQFYALFILLISFTPAFSSNLVLSNSEDFACGWTIKVSTTPQTKCKQSLIDGTVSAEVFSGNKAVEGLHYTWYYSGTVTKLGTGPSLSMLEAGSYYVEVRDPVSKCIQRAEATVEFKGEKPWFVVEHVENVLTCNADPYGRIVMRSENKWKSVWFRGDQVLDGKGITICMSTDECNDIPPGTYTIVYEDPSSGCRSDPYTLTVEGWPTTPVVNAAIIADTTCSGTGSGSLSLTAITPSPGTEPEMGYSYVWRNSSGVVLSQFANQAVASPLAAGTYTVVVQGNYSNPSLECGTSATFTVPHQPVIPVVSATATPNTICTPPAGGSYNGTITAAATYKGQTVTNFSNYTFTWTDTNGNTGSVTGTNKIEQLNGGTYTITARQITTGCTSDPYTVTVNNQLPVQTLTLSPVAQTNCNSSAPNGSITASYSITPANTSTPVFKWYKGTTVSAANEISGVTGNEASGLAGGVTYTVVVTDPGSGCQISRSVEVPLQSGVVTITAAAKPNLVCAPATSVNGSIDVTEVRFNDTPVTDLSGYTFSWYKGSSTTPIAGQSSATLTGLAAGMYSVTATRTDLGCTSDPITVEIKDQLPLLSLSLTPVAQTNCNNAAPNGELTAAFTVAGTTATAGSYRLNWYRGTTVSAATEITGITGNTATDLAGGVTYTVVATDVASGCSTTAAVEVPLQPAVITFDATPAANAICAPESAANGEITVDQLYLNGKAVTGFTGYTFSWAKEVNGTFTAIAVADASSNKLTGQAAGRYQVRVTHSLLECTSDPITLEIVNQLPVQTLTLNPTPQTNCDNTAPNGSITASYTIVPGTATPQLSWYRGTTVSAATEITGITGNTATDLAGGVTYTVVATDVASGCSTTAAVEVPLQPAVITFDATPAANAICAPVSAANGEITVDQLYLNGKAVTGFTGYTFSWAKEVNGTFTAIAVADASSNKLTGQAAGRYQVRVTHSLLECTSDPITVEIKDQLPLLSLSLTPFAQTSCNGTPNGEIAAVLSIDGATVSSSAYNLEWFAGTDTSTPLTTGTLTDDLAKNIAGALYYTVRATDINSGCQTVASVYVPAKEGVITLAYSTFANKICDPDKIVGGSYDGNIELTSVMFNGADQADVSRYEFVWYNQVGGVFTEYHREQGSAGKKLSNLPGGIYQVEVKNIDLECISSRITIQVNDEPEQPTVALTQTQQTSCDPANANGTMTATVSVGGVMVTDLSVYSFKWFSGTNTSGTAITTNLTNNDSKANQLASGYYTVQLTNTNTGCVATASLYLQENLTMPAAQLDVKNITSCEPDDHGVLTASAFENGVEVDYTHHNFSWYQIKSDGTTVKLTATGRSLDKLDDGSNLPTGYYTVVAHNTQTSCSSAPQTKYLAPPPALFAVSSTINRRPTICNQFAGVITAWVDVSGSRNTDDYTFEWYKGRPTDPNATFYSDPEISFEDNTPLQTIPDTYDFTDLDDMGAVAGTDYYLNGASIFGLRAGIYSVIVTDKISLCKEILIVELPNDNGHKAMRIDLINSETCPTGVGSVLVRATDKDGNPFTNQEDYIFYLYKGNNPVGVPYAQKAGDAGYTEFSNLPVGYYTFLAKETISQDQCESISQSFEIKQVAVPPAANISNIIVNTMCAGGNGAADIMVGPAEYEPGATDPVTSKFTVTLTGPTAVTPLTLVAAGTYKFEDLEAGTYTGTVQGFDEDDNYLGCATPITFKVPYQPPVITVQAAVTHQTYCSPLNGEINITAVSGGATTLISDYTFTWMDASGTVISGSGNGPAITGLAAGTYYVVATQNNATGAGSGCSSAPLEIKISNKSVNPTVALEADPNTSCDPAVYTGEVRIKTMPVGNFDYEWFFIQADGTKVSKGTGDQNTYLPVASAAPGLYRIEITAENGCQVAAEVVVTEQIVVPAITKVTATPQTTCDPLKTDGSITVEEVTYDGTTYAAPFTDFIFEWKDASGNVITGYTGATIPSRVSGTYTVEVYRSVNPHKNCYSAPFTITVPYEPVYPAVAFQTNTPNNACDTNYTGELTATVSFTDSYSYKLFRNGVALTAHAGSASTLTSLSFKGLQAGLYTLEIIQLNGCPVEAEITLQDAILKPAITTATASAQTACTFGDGSAAVTGVSYNGAPATLTDFTYEWYSDLALTTHVASGRILNQQLTAGTYYVVAKKIASPPGSGCESAPFAVTVPYEPVYPAVAFQTNTPNNACDTNYTGELTATVSFTDSYSYKLFRNGVALTAHAGSASTLTSLSFKGLQAGLYTLEIIQLNGCPVEAEITLQDAILKPVITTATASAQTACTFGDGSAAVTGVSYNGASATLTDFTYEWYSDLALTTHVASGRILNQQLTAGTYYVVAKKIASPPGSGCESAPFAVTVPYEPVYPAVAFQTNTPNNACDTNYTGELTATVSFTDSYSYQLFRNGVALTAHAGSASILTSLSFKGLQAGLYTLEIIQLNGCPVEAEITLQDAILKPVITSVKISPQTNCQSIGDGELEVDGISYNGISGTLADYTYEWFDATGNSIGSNILKDQLTAGNYYVVAKKIASPPGSGCESAPFAVTVPYEPVYPAVVFTTSINNTSCNASANGSFTATINNFGSHYSYTLYKNGAATTYAATNITNSTLSFSGMEEAEYKLVVTAVNSCPTEAIVTLVKEEVSSSLLISATDQLTCNPDGTITVNEISFNGQSYSGAAILANFSLSLLDEANVALNYTAASTAEGALYSNLPAAIYTIVATRLQPGAGSVAGQGCSVSYRQVISDVSVAPAIEVVEYNMISDCFGNPKGLIQVAVDGTTTNPGNYTVSWQFRQTTADALQPFPGTGFRITNLDPGFYTITTNDNNTGCTNTFEFEISEVVVDIAISASANDQTYCQPLDNGELFVRVVNQEEIRNTLGFLPKFDFEVYAGEWTTPPGSDYKYDARNASQFSQLNVSTSAYTVFAWFNGHLVCLGSDKAFVGYVDNTPMPTAQADAYLTICDPERPNASASASVNGVTDGYTFTWYKETIAPANKHHQEGPAVTELSEGKYVVEVYSIITGCTGYTEVEVSAQFPDVPFVDAMLTATSSTSCAAPNGSLEVNVVNRDGFDFTWYRGETADPAMLIQNGPLPYRQDNLAEGTYTVVATDKANGCISNAVSKHLGGNYTYPDYDIQVTPANCSINGTARVVDLSGRLREYFIYRGTDTSGTPLADHNTGTFSGIAGTYTLKVISEDGCEQTRPFEITDVVAPFNGVTANGDGDNDYFHLACIDLFPQNLVRIYNRAGGLVFEMSGYDNNLRVFDGTGNRGLYLGNKQLP